VDEMSKKKYKVLINTGGGYFGLTIASFLSYLGKNYSIPNEVDCISGTSIGGIITCALMAGCSGEQIL
jgi:predicted acylesterase/phospholipase RssA